MKTLFALLVFASFSAVAEFTIVAEEPALDADIAGFSGYAWGASPEFVIETITSDDYELISYDPKSIWYRTTFYGENIYVVYLFDRGRLNAGMWIFARADHEIFFEVSTFLRRTYNRQASLIMVGDNLRSEIRADNAQAKIVQVLDPQKGVGFQHVVHYYLDTGEE